MAPEFDLVAVGSIYNGFIFADVSIEPSPGRETFGGSFSHIIGGAGNVARAAVTLGLQTAMVSDYGDDIHTAIALEELARRGVTLKLECHAGWQTPVTGICDWNQNRGRVTVKTAPPYSIREQLWTISSRVVVTPLTNRPAPWLAELAPDTIVIGDCDWDVTGQWDLDSLNDYGKVSIFTPNALEASHFTGTTDATVAARQLAQCFPAVVVSRGKDGAVLATGNDVIEVVAPPVRAIDTSGAGECLVAALGYGMLQPSWSWETRLRYAVAAATLSVTRSGVASPAHQLEIEDFVGTLGDDWAELGEALHASYCTPFDDDSVA